MKYFILLSALLMGCVTARPALQEGSCYSIGLYGTTAPGEAQGVHELSQFKVIKIFDFENRKHYTIQMLKDEFPNDSWDLVPLYPKTKTYGYVAVDKFDKYVAPIAGKFSATVDKTVHCNPITPEEWEDGKNADRLPLMKVGSDD